MHKSRLLVILTIALLTAQPFAFGSETDQPIRIEKLVEYDKANGVYKYECQDGSVIESEKPFAGVKDVRPWKEKHPKITAEVVKLRSRCRWTLPILQAAGAVAQIISACTP